MKVGNAPISWGVCEIPNWGPQLPFERVLDEMAEAQYIGTELGPWGFMPDDPEVLGEHLRRRNLSMAAAFVPVDLRSPGRLEPEWENVRQTAELLKAVGANHIILSDGGDEKRNAIAGRLEETERHGLSDDQWAYFGASLNELADRVGEMGLSLSFHSHGGTYVENPKEIQRLCEVTDPSKVKLCLDTGHIAFGGGDPVEVFQAYSDRVGHVHLKDIRLEDLKEKLQQGEDYVAAAKSDVFVALGDGDVDIPQIIDVLKSVEYDGWLIVEQDRVLKEDENSLAAPVKSRAYLREHFGL